MIENVNRTGDFFSPLPGVRGFCGVPRGRFSFFRGHGGVPVPGRMRPPFSPPGREPSRGASLAPSGQFTSCVAPGGREAPGEPFRWGSPGPLRDDTKRGGPRVPPLWKHPPWGTGAGNPPATAKRPCPPPLLRKGGIPRNHLTFSRKVPSYPQQPRCGSEKRTAGHPGGTPAFATAICG